MTQESAWWQRAVIYQIYPWSFQDSNGDGIGDLPGIIGRLDYLNDGTDRSLGVDAIWLSPIYPSPMKDFGYDVADYCEIDPRFGTLADFDRLVGEAHRRGIRVLMDLVLNHTSDQHPWFRESRASRQSAKRGWYLWADPGPSGRRPSNWVAVFGGSAWEWDPTTKQYYLHSFLKEQPDLNWSHPDVQHAMQEVMRFWLDRGVDGFRLDAINWIGKDQQWPDNPRRYFAVRSYLRQLQRYNRDQPLTHDVLERLRLWTNRYPHVVMVGEASSDTPGGPATFYGDGQNQLHLVFNFRLLKTAWDPVRFRRVIGEWDRAVPAAAWPTQVLSNHDQSRHYSRYGRGVDPETAERRAHAAAVLLLTLRGTPFLYYGEEIGMRDGKLRYHQLRDPYTKRYWLFQLGRDPARTPMQWDETAYAGFSSNEPWLPVAPDFRDINVAKQSADPCSLLSLYRRLIRLRKQSAALRSGTYEEVPGAPLACLVYRRDHPGPPRDACLIAVNMGRERLTFGLPALKERGTILLSTRSGCSDVRFDPAHVTLHPDEAWVVRLDISRDDTPSVSC